MKIVLLLFVIASYMEPHSIQRIFLRPDLPSPNYPKEIGIPGIEPSTILELSSRGDLVDVVRVADDRLGLGMGDPIRR